MEEIRIANGNFSKRHHGKPPKNGGQGKIVVINCSNFEPLAALIALYDETFTVVEAIGYILIALYDIMN